MNDLNRFMDGQRKTTEKQYDEMFNRYVEELNNSLELDVENNKDREIRREYDSLLNKASTPFENEIKKINSSFEEKNKIIKKENLKDEEEKE